MVTGYKETSTTAVQCYEGTFTGDEEGIWNFIIVGTQLTGYATFAGALAGTVSDNSISITLGYGTANGTISDADVSGTWNYDFYGTYSGTWTGSRTDSGSSDSGDDDDAGGGDVDVTVEGTITASINGNEQTSTYTGGIKRIFGLTGYYYSLTFRNSSTEDVESTSYYPSIELFFYDDERLSTGYTYDHDDFGDGSSITQCGFHFQATSPYVDNVWFSPDCDNNYSFSITIVSWDSTTGTISGTFTGTLVRWGYSSLDSTIVTCEGNFSSQGLNDESVKK